MVGGGILYAGGFAFDAEGYERPAAALTKREVDPLMLPRRIETVLRSFDKLIRVSPNIRATSNP